MVSSESRMARGLSASEEPNAIAGSHSHLPRIVGPVEQGLPLFAAAGEVAAAAVLLDLRDVPADGPPALDLAIVVGPAPPQVIAAIPLKPAARIVGMDPALGQIGRASC